MVAIGSEKYLGGHAKKAGGLPHRHASLHEPRRRRVAQGVRRHLAAQTRQPYRASEAFFDRSDRLAVEFNEAVGDQFWPGPAAHVGQ